MSLLVQHFAASLPPRLPKTHALRTHRRTPNPTHPGAGRFRRRFHRRHRRWRGPAHHPGPAHCRHATAPGTGHQQAQFHLRLGHCRFHLLQTQTVPPGAVAPGVVRHLDRGVARRRHRPLHASRMAEQDAASDRLRLWHLPVVRRHAQGAAGCRCTDQEKVASAARLHPGLLRRRSWPGYRCVLDGQYPAAVPHRPGTRQRRGAQHELRQQHRGADGVHHFRAGGLHRRPVQGPVGEGRRTLLTAARTGKQGYHSPAAAQHTGRSGNGQWTARPAAAAGRAR